jgi:hypothetical protein
LRYLHCRILIFEKERLLYTLIAAVLEPLLSMLITLGRQLLPITLIRND